jgi:hypothetical protein
MESPSSPRETVSQFEKLLVGLARAEVDFAVVGGVAVILNGYHRQTNDTDILVHPDPENIRRLLAHLATWGEGWARELKPEEFIPQEGSIRLMEEFELDLFTQMRGRQLDDFRPQLRYLQSGDARIPYLHPQQLIELKTGSWRDKDRLDVQAMQEILRREAAGETAPTI